ncbi:MAG: hypothetical protein AAGJ35_11165, partial [Myxococcota bacterium]
MEQSTGQHSRKLHDGAFTEQDPSAAHELLEQSDSFVPRKPSAIDFDPESMDVLEWGRVKEILASFCHTLWGKRQALQHPFYGSKPQIEFAYQQVDELLSVMEITEESLPLRKLPSLFQALRRLEKGGHLAPAELFSLGDALLVVAEVRDFLEGVKQDIPALWEYAELLQPLSGLRRAIAQAVDEHGQLREEASWALGALRGQV